MTYNNPVRAGYSYDTSDAITDNPDPTNIEPDLPRDAADDNYNAFDPYPLGHNGEVNDSDSYDGAGALILPVDRMRALHDAGRHQRHRIGHSLDHTARPHRGADPLGRVTAQELLPSPGTPGSIATSPSTPVGEPCRQPLATWARSTIRRPAPTGTDFFYTHGPNNNPIPAAPHRRWPIRLTCPT